MQVLSYGGSYGGFKAPGSDQRRPLGERGRRKRRERGWGFAGNGKGLRYGFEIANGLSYMRRTLEHGGLRKLGVDGKSSMTALTKYTIVERGSSSLQSGISLSRVQDKNVKMEITSKLGGNMIPRKRANPSPSVSIEHQQK